MNSGGTLGWRITGMRHTPPFWGGRCCDFWMAADQCKKALGHELLAEDEKVNGKSVNAAKERELDAWVRVEVFLA